MLKVGKIYINKNRYYLILNITKGSYSNEKRYDSIYCLSSNKIWVYDRGIFEDCVEEL